LHRPDEDQLLNGSVAGLTGQLVLPFLSSCLHVMVSVLMMAVIVVVVAAAMVP